MKAMKNQQSQKTQILFLAFAICVVCAGIFLYIGSNFDSVRSMLPGQEQSRILEGEVTVTMTRDGFEPQHLRVRKGTTVTFVSAGEVGHWPASDLHPSHSIYSAFDPNRVIPAGESWAFTFDEVGDWGMHDHVAPYIVGSISVVE
jgi:plastocyanin